MGDVSAIKALYSHSADATSFFGWGGYERGWGAVEKRWDWAGRQFNGGSVSYENLTTVVAQDMFFVTDIETYTNQRMAALEGVTGWSNRVTHVFRMRQLQADVAGCAARITPVRNFLPVEHDNEMIAVDGCFDRVPVVRDDLHVVRRFAHVDDAAGEEVTAAVVAGVSIANLQFVAGAAGIRGRLLTGW